MSAIIDTGPNTPCPQTFNLTAHVLARADDLHDKIALSIISPQDVDNWTFGALKSAVMGTATGLLESGLAPGQKIMLRLGNTVDFPSFIWLQLLSDSIQFRFRRNLRPRNWKNSVPW